MRLTFVQSEHDNSSAWIADWDWSEAAHHLTTHRRLPAKGDLGVIFARFVDGPCRRKARTGRCTDACPGHDHRIDENVESVTALGLDFDEATPAQLDALMQILITRGLRFLAYTTWGSTPTAPKIRVVLALDAEVPRDQFRGFWDAVIDELGIRPIVDTKCRNPGRLFFTPQCPVDGVPSAAAYEGTPLATGPYLARVTPDTIDVAEIDDTEYPPAAPALLAHALGRLAQHGPAIAGKGGNAHTRTAWGILVNDLALSEQEARAVFRMWDLTNQPPWGEEAWTGPARSDQAWSGPRGVERAHFEAARSNVDIFGDVPARPADEYGVDLLEYMGDDDPGDSQDDWLIQQLIASGVPQMIAGHPKSYKTFLLEYLALCTAMGLPAFDRFPVKRARCLLLPREDSVRETRRRLWRLGRGIAAKHYGPKSNFDLRDLREWLMVDTLRPFYWTDQNHMRALLTTIDRRQLKFVMVDSLSRSHLGDENSVKDMAPVVNTWADVCQQFGVAVPIIHHFTKSGTGTLLQQLRGSGSIGAVVRHLIGVEKSANRGEPFELSFEGNLHPLADAFKIEMRDETDSAGHKIITFAQSGLVTASPVPKAETLDEGIARVLEVLWVAEERRELGKSGNPIQLSRDDVRTRTRMGKPPCTLAINNALAKQFVRLAEPYGLVLTDIGRGAARVKFAPK